MSYILEALKKAEAERRAEAAQVAPLPFGLSMPPASRHSGRRRRLLPVSLALALLGIAGAAAWYARDGAMSQQGAGPVAQQPAAPAHAAAAPDTPVPAETAPPAPVAPPPAEPAVKPKESLAKKQAQKRRPPASMTTDDATPDRPVADSRVPTLRELPEQVQREIPAFSVGGYIYSGNRADRSVLINKRLLREGDEIAPGLTLEQMQQNGMVLNFSGYRYRVSY